MSEQRNDMLKHLIIFNFPHNLQFQKKHKMIHLCNGYHNFMNLLNSLQDKEIIILVENHREIIQMLPELKGVKENRDLIVVGDEISCNSKDILCPFFSNVIAKTHDDFMNVLPKDDLIEAIQPECTFSRIIAGTIDSLKFLGQFYTADVRPFVVNLNIFNDSANSPSPDFDDFEIIDCGNTIRFGEYEASTTSVLYEAGLEV